MGAGVAVGGGEEGADPGDRDGKQPAKSDSSEGEWSHDNVCWLGE